MHCCGSDSGMASFHTCRSRERSHIELVAEPIQEPQVGEQQEDAVEHASEEIANPADLQGKPRSITLILSIQCLFKYFMHLHSRSCMEL